jgi:16S rRNA (guanine966-N2)-methyltransferase
VPEAGRVITGSAGGLRLEAPGPGTRPLSDRVKQSLFSLLEAERPDIWEHAVLDCFAGSGAFGIEALSRGAPCAVLVERDARAAAVIARNLAHTGLAHRAQVVRRDVAAFLSSPPGGTSSAPGGTSSAWDGTPFGCAFVDPPYAHGADLLATLERLASPAAAWLDGAALVVAKHFWKAAPPERVGMLERRRERRFGETALSVYRRARDVATSDAAAASETAAGGS